MISNKLSANEVTTALKMINKAERIVIFTHMSPDGDAMGSSLGLRHWISATFPEKAVSVIVPNDYPDFLSWMPGVDEVCVFEHLPNTNRTLIDDADLFICTDFNEPKRIGGAGTCLIENVQKGTPVLVIDHHILNPASTDLSDAFVISYPDSPSASELVYRLIHQISLNPEPLTINPQPSTLNLATATCLYTGMMTDTGNFSFNSNYPEMYEIVGDLVRLGVNKDEIYNAVFNAHSADRMRLVGYCLYNKMRIMPVADASSDSKVALIALTRKDLYRFNFKSGDAEGIVNMPLSIREVRYSVFMREDKVQPYEKERANGAKTKVKISFRSQGNHPVNIFAHDFFHGGGHMNASGGEFFGSVRDAIALFDQHYLDYFKE